MPDKKISQLTAWTPLDTDIIPYVDLVVWETKYTTKTNLVWATAVTSVNTQTWVVVLDTWDLLEATDKNYVTDAEKVVIWNTTNINSWDITVTDTAEVDLTLTWQDVQADLKTTTVTPWSYTSTNLTVDSKWRITSAANWTGWSWDGIVWKWEYASWSSTWTIEQLANNWVGDFWLTWQAGQTFTPSVNISMSSIALKFGIYSTYNTTINIYAVDWSWYPTWASLGNKTESDAADITFTFASPISLTGWTQYAFVVTNDSGSTSGGAISIQISWDPYVSGSRLYSSDSWSNWTTYAADDTYFIISYTTTSGWAYDLNDSVSYLWAYYVAIQAVTSQLPTDTAYWDLIVDWAGGWDVTWPWSSTDNALARFDLTTGKIIQNGTITQDDSWNLASVWTINGNTIATWANTWDQTSIVWITWTTAQFNTANTDWDFATLTWTETLTNKTITGNITAWVLNATDSTTSIKNITDPTRIGKFNASVISSWSTRTYNLPDSDGQMALLTNITDGVLTTQDITTNNFTTAKHWFVPKWTNVWNYLKDDWTWAAIWWGWDALTTNPLSQFAATTSLQLKWVISDETWSWALVFGTNPTLITPILWTPASWTLTNCTFPTLNQNTTGTASNVTWTVAVANWGTWATTLAWASIPTYTSTNTFTNKRITERTNTITSSSTPTPAWDTTDIFTITALAVAATIAAPTWTPTNWQKLIIRIKDNGTARVLSWNAIYTAWDVDLPTTTILSKTMYCWFIYNSTSSKWNLLAYNDNFTS